MTRHKLVSYHCIFLTFIFYTCNFLLSDFFSVFYMAVAHLYVGSRRTETSLLCTKVCGASSDAKAWTVPWHRLLFAALLPPCRGFSPRLFNGGFILDTVAVLPVSLRVIQVLPVRVILVIHHTHELISLQQSRILGRDTSVILLWLYSFMRNWFGFLL
jgi:hypothetical protein